MKKRDAYYCNLKFLLIFLVVFGHWIEPYIAFSTWAAGVYRIVYAAHMPLFIFLSGVFLDSGDRAKTQAYRMLLWYLIVQTIIILASKIYGNIASFCRPFWHLWYLLSLSQWSFLYWGLERWGRLSRRPLWVRWGVVLLAVGVGCAAGCLPWVGREWSLSRTLAFFPYLLAGRFCPKNIFCGKYFAGFAALAGFGVTYLLCGPYIPTSFFYQAESYEALGPAWGIGLRLICYWMGGLLGIGVLALTPNRRLIFSPLGANTLGIYLCHAPLAGLFRLLPLSPVEMLWAGPFASLWIVCLLWQAFRWRGPLYAIRRMERKADEI